ncbi:phospholipase D/nuclease [Xylariomycetidae sp. FL2044]|nr:phospholipase D/nuclease [Xylariomycetidae sp. FL2044]
MAEPLQKRRRLSSDEQPRNIPGRHSTGPPASLTRPISPPRRKRLKQRSTMSSPFRLTTIKDLPEHANVGAVSLKDILGDPLIAEVWEFNYLHDVDFLMSHFDEDTKSLVKVHLVHGFWKREDQNRLALEEQASQHKNVNLHTAFMPEMFGTHHSKMLILIRHDDTAQIIIHTANMIAKDWTNMTNGVWQSPLLPKLRNAKEPDDAAPKMGSGAKFKIDILSYLRAYNTRRSVCGSLVEELKKYDFSAIRAALVASVPGKHDLTPYTQETCWGWAGLKHALRSVPVQVDKSELVVQISSVATLGATDAWLQRTLFDALSSSSTKAAQKPDFKIVFPTADEIRKSLDGYASGGSIHMKIESAAQVKQLQYMRPILHHWANDSEDGTSLEKESIDGGRKRAAPHIKTYIRYNRQSGIDWALLTSANMSKQAWGEATNAAGQMRIASWEIGVLVWPELLAGDATAKMVGTFKTDMPSLPSRDDPDKRSGNVYEDGQGPLIGLRVPYNLPLQRYSEDEIPWVATKTHSIPDWTGRVWGGF